MEKDVQKEKAGLVEWLSLFFILIVFLLFYYPIVIDMFTPGREHKRITNCLSNQRKIAQAMQLYAQEHAGILPGTLTWRDGKITSSHTRWVKDVALPAKVLQCKDNTASLAYGMPVALAGSDLTLLPTSNDSDVLLTADASPEYDSQNHFPGSADGLFFSKADICLYLHGSSPTTGFIASFLDGHVSFIHPESPGTILIDALDATIAPVSQTGSDLLYQGADHLFIIDGARGIISGRAFSGMAAGRTCYFAFNYSSLPAKGQGITIKAPGGLVTLLCPTRGKYYTIFVRTSDVKHKIAAMLKGTELTISNNN